MRSTSRCCVLLVILTALSEVGTQAAEAVPDERESPTLRQSLPAVAAPADAESASEEQFSAEAPLPPPFDPNYRPPGVETSEEPR